MASAVDLARALSSGDRLEFFAQFNSRILELLGGGPAGWRLREAAELNPQPLPPVAVGHEQVLLMASMAIAVGEGGDKTFMADLDDWCGTGWPRRWPRPKRFGQEEIVDLLLGAGMGAARLAAAYEDGPQREMFDAAANQLFDAALGQR